MTAISEKLRHICEVCGLDENLTPDEAFELGWDYPPRMGTFGVVSARTCPNCPINKTVWWKIMVDKSTSGLTPEQMEVVNRISDEPESIRVNAEQPG